MRILICGARDFADRELLAMALDMVQKTLDPEPIVIHGDAKGADRMAGHEAGIRGLWCWPCPAKWYRQGRAAGPLRNQRMLEQARPDWVLAFPADNSKGTWDMVCRAEGAGLPIWIVRRSQQGLGLEARNTSAGPTPTPEPKP